jgi:large subunit ribosomal protein L10
MAYETRVTEEKIGFIDNLKEAFKNSSDFIFANYRGLNVPQMNELRDKLREANSGFRVVKNRYAKIALKDMDQPEVDDMLIGPTAVALPTDEATPVAKVLVDFQKEYSLEIKGGIIEGNVFTADQVVEFSKLPTRDELIAKLMGTMNAPVQKFVTGLNQIPSKFVRTLQAVADQKKEQGE